MLYLAQKLSSYVLLKSIKNNQIFHVRQNSTQRFFQYRIDKITQFKLYLRCKSVKCSSRLEVILGFELKTEKVGNNWQFHVIISVPLLNMTSAAPLSVVLSLLSQRKEGKRGRSVSHV